MAIPPILGASILELNDLIQLNAVDAVPWGILLAGGLSAFFVGVIACRIMVQLVLRNKLVYFAAYCAIVGICHHPMANTLTAKSTAFLSEEELRSGAVLAIKKPLGWTSFDVVNKIRWDPKAIGREEV